MVQLNLFSYPTRVSYGAASVTFQDDQYKSVVIVTRASADSWDWQVQHDGKFFFSDQSARLCNVYESDEALSALLTFLSAFGEAQRYPESDNRDLFDKGLVPFIEYWSDEVSVAGYELDTLFSREEDR